MEKYVAQNELLEEEPLESELLANQIWSMMRSEGTVTGYMEGKDWSNFITNKLAIKLIFVILESNPILRF